MTTQVAEDPRVGPDVDEWVGEDAGPGDRWFAVYGRISDAGEDEATKQAVIGIERQLEDCDRLARQLGAKRIRYYREGGSAYDGRKRNRKQRRVFEQLLDDIRAGEVSHVLAWRVERLAREPRDMEALIEAADGGSVGPRTSIRTVDGQDSGSETGMFMIRLLTMFGRWESVQIANRVRRARQADIRGGGFTGSPPAFGHRDGTRWAATVPEEAALIQEFAERTIAGEGVRSILRDFNTRGSRTRKGAHWQHRAFIKLITSPRMIGARELAGELHFGADKQGEPLIQPILSRETWDKVRAILLDPARLRPGRGGTPRHLLTGLMRCGAVNDGKTCNSRLSAKGSGDRSHAADYWTYGCVKDAFRTENCGRVWIKGSRTDEYIEGRVLAYLRQPTVTAALMRTLGSPDEPDETQAALRERLEALQESLTRLEVAYLDGPAALEAEAHVSPAAYLRYREKISSEIDGLKKAIGKTARQRTVLRALAAPVDFWNQATLEERRDLVGALFPSIVVRPVADVPGASPRRWDWRRIEATPIA